MSTLDPRIQAQLAAFARRRRRLIIVRGLCATVAMLVGAMMLVALLDWLFVLPDWLRWTLSAGAYLSVPVVAWCTTGPRLFQVLDARRLASLIEGVEPALREELLSAVELGQGSGEWDSPQFRALVQADVSQRVEGLRMERLLPAILLRTVALILVVLVALCLGALLLPSLRFGALLARALLPGANLERVSAVQVKIIQPDPIEGPVAQGDTVPLLVELSGKRVTSAYLETFTKSGGRSVLALQPAANGRFSAAIQVAREDVEYRVRAFDAITRKYRLQAAARPSVVRFQKKFRFPAYTGLATREAIEEGGDLEALEGTQVELTLQTDQPVKLARLRLEIDHKTQQVPLTPRGDGWVTATLPLDKSFIYRVELVSAATGFENKFSPEYEARAVPDLIPEMTLTLPQRDTIASPHEIIPLAGWAKDDIGLTRVEQHIRIEQGPWLVRLLSEKKGVESRIEERWDLFQQGVHPGDSVATKLVAIDCKGNRGESRPITLTIAAAGFERQREEALAAERQLLQELGTWRQSSEKLQQVYRENLRPTLDHGGAEFAARQGTLALVTGAIDACQTQGVAVQAQIAATMRLAMPGHETANLVLLSRLAARGQSALQFLPYQLAGLGAEMLTDSARELGKEAEGTCAGISGCGKLLEELGTKLVVSEEVDVAAENVQVVAREMENLTQLAEASADAPRSWSQVAARLKVVLAEIATTEEGMKGAFAYPLTEVGDRMKRLARRFGDQRAATAALLSAGEPSKELLAAVFNLNKVAKESWQNALELKRDFAAQPQGAVQQLYEQVEESWRGFPKLKQEVEDLLRAGPYAPEQRELLAGGRWGGRTLLWKSYGDIEELRADADTTFVRDLRSVQTALEANREELLTPGAPPTRESAWGRLDGVDQAFRFLEIVHELTQLAVSCEGLAVAEHYQTASLHARTSNSSDWYRLEQRLRAADNDISRANVANREMHETLEEVRRLVRAIPSDPALRLCQEEMPPRLRREHEPVELSGAAERLGVLVRQALELLQEPAELARQTIAAAAPTLPERMAQLAREAKSLQAATQERAEQAAVKAPAQGQAEAQEHLAQQQGLNKKLETLKDAIRAEANLQNMMEAPGREKARDADDALALLREPPVRAEQALEEATRAERSSEQKAALESASQEEGKLAAALEQLSQHYDALENGAGEKSRLALREAEKELGVKKTLDEQYAKAEALAQAAQSSPEGMLKKLEQALARNPFMRQELSSVSRELLQDAGEKLAAASKQESAVARELERMAAAPKPKTPTTPPASPDALAMAKPGDAAAQPPADAGAQPKPDTPPAQAAPDANKPSVLPGAAQDQNASAPGDPLPPPPKPPTPSPLLASAAEQQKGIGQNAAEAGNAVERAGRHEERLQNSSAGQQLQKLGAAVKATASTEIPKAALALTTAQAPSEASPAVSAAERGLQEQLARLGKSGAPPASPAAETPSAPTPAGEKSMGPNQDQPNAPAPGTMPLAAPAPADGTAPNAPSLRPEGRTPLPAGTAAPAPASPGPQPAGASPLSLSSPADLAALPPGLYPMGNPEMISAPAPAPQQVWMARALDALDAALHESPAGSQSDKDPPGQPPPGQNPPPGGPGQPQPGQEPKPAPGPGKAPGKSMQQAQKAMAAAGQAQAAEMRSSRSNSTPGQPSAEEPKESMMSQSEQGAMPGGSPSPGGVLPSLTRGATANQSWGKLPKKVAEQLTQGQRESVSAEYQKEVETYYRVIAERARQNTPP